MSCRSDVVCSVRQCKGTVIFFRFQENSRILLSLVATTAPTGDLVATTVPTGDISGKCPQKLSHTRDSPCCDMKNFYLLYQPYLEITPQIGEQITQQVAEQKENAITPQLGEQIQKDIFSIGWGHHKVLIDKYSKYPEKALFFVHQTVENGWSRDMLLNFMGTDLYERQGKALTKNCA